VVLCRLGGSRAGRHTHSLALFGLTPGAGASRFGTALAGLLSSLVYSPCIYSGILRMSPPNINVFIVSFSDNEQV
jgi:hypothetical protein